MKKKIFAVVILILICMSTYAQRLDQNYTTALGVKVWGQAEAGISLKHFLPTKNHALEGIGYFWYHGVRFTGLYEFHFDFYEAPGLKWYVGPGAHLGFYNDNYRDQYVDNGREGAFVGIDGVLGLDYKFKNAPINISLDWQPSIEFGTINGFQAGWGGFGMRYTF